MDEEIGKLKEETMNLIVKSVDLFVRELAKKSVETAQGESPITPLHL